MAFAVGGGFARPGRGFGALVGDGRCAPPPQSPRAPSTRARAPPDRAAPQAPARPPPRHRRRLRPPASDRPRARRARSRWASSRSSAAAAASPARAASRASRSAASAAVRAASAGARNARSSASAPVALRERRCDRRFEAGQLAGQLGQPVGADQPLGGRGARAGRDEAVPPAQPAVARDQPLADRQRLPLSSSATPTCAGGAASSAGASTWSARQLAPAASAGSPARCSLPSQRRGAIAADRRVGILAKRRRQRALIAGLGSQAGDRRAPPCSSARASASCSDFAADSAARAAASALSAASRRSARSARPCSASARAASASAKRRPPQPGLARSASSRAAVMLAAVAERVKLLRQACRCSCSVRASCACAASSAASATRRSARIAACRASNSASAASASRDMVSAPVELGRDPRRDCASASSSRCSIAAALLLELGDRRGGIALQRLLARDVGGERCVEPVELREPARDRVAPRPGRRQLDAPAACPASRAAASALRRSASTAAAWSCTCCASAIAAWIAATSSSALALRRWRRQPRCSASTHRAWSSRASTRADLVGQLAVAFGRPRLPPELRGALLLLGEDFAQPRRGWPRSREASARHPCGAREARKCPPPPRASAAARPAWPQ